MAHKEHSLMPIKHSVAKWKVCLVQYVKAQPICRHLPLNGVLYGYWRVRFTILLCK